MRSRPCSHRLGPGESSRETGAFLLAALDQVDHVTGVAIPESSGVMSCERSIRCMRSTIDRLFTWAAEHKVRVRAQVHSHSCDAFLSRTDVRHGFSVEGFITSVVPRFASPPEDPDEWGWWIFSRANGQPSQARRSSPGQHRHFFSMINKSVFPEYSRSLRLAEGVTRRPESELLAELERSHVHLTVDAGHPGDAVAAELLLSTLRRLPCRLSLDPTDLPTDAIRRTESIVGAIAPNRPLKVESDCAVRAARACRSARSNAAISGVPVGHGARIGRGIDLGDGGEASGLGAMTCASLLAAEIFKDLAQVLPERAVRHDYLSWCPVTLSDSPENIPVRVVPPGGKADLAIVGIGAVGSAMSRISQCSGYRGD